MCLSLARMIFPILKIIPKKMILGTKEKLVDNDRLETWISKAIKIAIRLLIVFVISIVVIALVSLAIFFMLADDGAFDEIYEESPIITPGNNTDISSGYDSICRIISSIDMGKLKDSKLLVTAVLNGDTKTNIVPRGMSAYSFLRMYALYGEICSQENINPSDSKIHITPALLMAIHKHENGLSFGVVAGKDWNSATQQERAELDPYAGWSSGYAYLPMSLTVKDLNSGKTEKMRHYATLMGQSALTFREYMPMVKSGATPPAKHAMINGMAYAHMNEPLNCIACPGTGIPMLFISSAENKEYSGSRAIVGVNNSDILKVKDSFLPEQITSSVTTALKFKEHPEYPWGLKSSGGGTAVQRPSCLFLPDVAATTAYSFRMMTDGRNVSTGMSDAGSSGAIVEVSKQLPESEREFMISSWMSIRAGKLGMYLKNYKNDLSIGQMIVEDIVAKELVSKLTGTKCLDALKLTTMEDVLYNLTEIVMGATGTRFSEGEYSFSQETINSLIQYLGLAGGSIELTETTKQLSDGLYLLMCEKLFNETAKIVAEQMYLKFPGKVMDTEDGGGASAGGNSSTNGFGKCNFDKDFDGLCDECKGSIFSDGVDGCKHQRQFKIVFPYKTSRDTVGITSISTLKYPTRNSCNGYHDRIGSKTDSGGKVECGYRVHSNGHFGYDMGSGGKEIVSVADGVAVYHTAKGVGYGVWVELYVMDPAVFKGEIQNTVEFIMNNATYVMEYAHLSAINAGVLKSKDVGVIVPKGTVLGVTGNKGLGFKDNTTAAHLHFQINRGSQTKTYRGTYPTLGTTVNYLAWSENGRTPEVVPEVVLGLRNSNNRYIPTAYIEYVN